MSYSNYSSFIECVRTNNQRYSSIAYNSPSCNSPPYEECSFTQSTRLTLSSSAAFTSCIWRECSALYGGGVCLNMSDSALSLSVIKGEFYYCSASIRGGGIYAEGIGEVTVTNTFFFRCSAESSNGSGGGGIEMWNLQKLPRIDSSSFLACKTADNAGGVGIWNTPSAYQGKCVLSCRFMQCEVNLRGGSDGGSLMMWFSNASIQCTETVFLDSHSEYHGGAASYYIYSSAGHESSLHLFVFCFFKNNTSRTTPGNDVYFREWTPSQPFLQCFSLSATNRVYCDPSGATYNNNWLP